MVLRCVCFHCSRLMADPSDYRVQAAQKLKSQRRLEAMHALCRTQKRCEFATKEELDAAILEGGDPEQASYGCGALQPQFRKRNAQSIEVEFSADDEHVPGLLPASCLVPSRRRDAAGASMASRGRRDAVDARRSPSKQRRLRRPQADPERAQGARGVTKCVRPRRETARPGPATRAAGMAPTHGPPRPPTTCQT